MTQKANSIIIGTFVLGAIFLAVAAVLLFASERFNGDKQFYVLFFQSDTSGLDIGAPVVLKGVKIGAVSEIGVGYSQHFRNFEVRVLIAINNHNMNWIDNKTNIVDRGIIGRLATQSFVTGKLIVELGFYDKKLAITSKIKENFLQIPTVPTELEAIRETLKALPLEKIVAGVGNIISKIDHLLDSQEISKILQQVIENLLGLKQLLKASNVVVHQSQEHFNEMNQQVQNMLKTLTDEISASSRAFQHNTLHAQVGFNKTLSKMNQQIPRLANELSKVLKNSNQTAINGKQLLSSDSMLQTELLTTLREISRASRALNSVLEYLERHPESLIRGR